MIYCNGLRFLLHILLLLTYRFIKKLADLHPHFHDITTITGATPISCNFFEKVCMLYISYRDNFVHLELLFITIFLWNKRLQLIVILNNFDHISLIYHQNHRFCQRKDLLIHWHFGFQSFGNIFYSLKLQLPWC